MSIPIVSRTLTHFVPPLAKYGVKIFFVKTENIIKMFPVRVINAGAPAAFPAKASPGCSGIC